MTMNTVTVRLMSSILLLKSLEMAGIAGRYMFAVKGLRESQVNEHQPSRTYDTSTIVPTHLKSAEKAAKPTIHHLS